MRALTLVFVAFLIAGTALRLWLTARQLRAVRAGRGRVPVPFDARIGLADHQKAADYTIARARLGAVEGVVDGALLIGWTLGGGLAVLDRVWAATALPPLAAGAGVIMSALVLMSVITLPFSLYRTFLIEERFGFNRTTARLYAADQLRGLALLLLLGTPLVLLILWFMRGTGAAWWLYAWLAWAVFTMALSWAFPTFIAPLFNRFTPLADSALAARIEALLERCGFRSKGIFVMDGSRRSSHGNAYFTGVGNSKRIVFFDTLMQTLEPPEIEAVLAHELGHFSRHHVRKRLALVFVLALAGFALLGWLARQAWFYAAFGVQASPHMALLLFMLVAPVFTFPLTPLAAALSRRHEFEADAYAVEHSDARCLAQALVKLYRDNATTLTPDPIHSRFYDSHPPAPIRVARLGTLVTR
jgi:STE24 endopeptidase